MEFMAKGLFKTFLLCIVSYQVIGQKNVYVEKWFNVTGETVSQLLNSSHFANQADETSYEKSFYLLGNGAREYYGARFRAYFVAPGTGNYTFLSWCDDSCQLRLSPNPNPLESKVILYQTFFVPKYRPWGKSARQRSSVQYLEEGKSYYMEGLFKEKTYADFFGIGVVLPDGRNETPIASHYFMREALPENNLCPKEKESRQFPEFTRCKLSTNETIDRGKSSLHKLQLQLENMTSPSQEYLHTLFQIGGTVSDSLIDDWKAGIKKDGENRNSGFQIGRAIEEFGEAVAGALNETSTTILIKKQHLVMQVGVLDEEYVFQGPASISFAAPYTLPPPPEFGEYRVFSVMFNDLNELVETNISLPSYKSCAKEDKMPRKYVLNSKIVTTSLVPMPNRTVKDLVQIQLDHTLYNDSGKMACSFWNHSLNHMVSGWSLTGCRVDSNFSHEGSTRCVCDHLTSFAVLMQLTELKPPEVHLKALEMITYVGCSVSLFGEVLTVLGIACLRLYRSEANIIHLNLVSAIAVSQVVFLAGIEATRYKVLCKFVAVCLHYFTLVAFSWMLVEGVYLYVLVVKVFDGGHSRIRQYALCAWGIPLMFVVITLSASYDGYGTPTSCWLSVSKGTIWSFAVPVLVMALINFIILGCVVREIVKLHSTSGGDNTKINCARSGAKSAIILLPLLGITWLFGALTFSQASIAFQYIFALFNSFQGFFIFLFHFLMNSEVKKAFNRKRQIWSESHVLFHSQSQTPTKKYDTAENSNLTLSTMQATDSSCSATSTKPPNN